MIYEKPQSDERSFGLEHFRRTSGYAWLFVILLVGVILLTLLFAGLTARLGLDAAWQIAGVIIFLEFWGIGYIMMQRFLSVENRLPTFWEANVIGVKSLAFFFGSLLVLVLSIAALVLMAQLLMGNLGGGEGGGAGTGGASGKDGPTDKQKLQALQGALGLLGTMILLYLAPFINLMVLARLFKSKSISV